MFQTRLFAPIFYLNREHFLFVYVVIQKQATSFANFIKKNHGFSKFLKIEFFQRLIFENSIIYKLSLGHVRSHKNLGLIRRFYRKNRGFSKFSKIEFCWRQFFFSSIRKPRPAYMYASIYPWGHARSHKTIGPDRFSRFDDY